MIKSGFIFLTFFKILFFHRFKNFSELQYGSIGKLKILPNPLSLELPVPGYRGISWLEKKYKFLKWWKDSWVPFPWWISKSNTAIFFNLYFCWAYLAIIAAFEKIQNPIDLFGSEWCPGGLVHTKALFELPNITFFNASIDEETPMYAASRLFLDK